MISLMARLRELRQERSEIAAAEALTESALPESANPAAQPSAADSTGALPPGIAQQAGTSVNQAIETPEQSLPAAIPAPAAHSLPANYMRPAYGAPVVVQSTPDAAGAVPAAYATVPVATDSDWQSDSTWQAMDDEDFDDEDDVEFSTSPVSRLAEIVPPGFRHSKRQVAGTLVSIALHAAVLVLVANLMMPTPALNFVHEIQSWLIDPDQDEPIPEPELTLAPPDEEMSDSALASMAMSVASVQNDEAYQEREPILQHAEDPLIELAPDLIEPPEGYELSDVVVHRGRVGEEVQHVEGAVDRITHEIMTRMEYGPVLVIYLMDASISLVDDRQKVADRLERVYNEVDQFESADGARLLSAVVGYGEKRQELTPPTADGAVVVDAIRNVPTDDSGLEYVFSAVVDSINRYKILRTREQRQTMIVIWTDESGDDYSRLEEAVQTCQRLTIPVFTVGPSAMFGREKGTHAYVHPDDGQTYMLPVNRGPDTVRQEWINLPYWFQGPQHNTLHSGLGPYALTRLAMETGGAYFINDHEADRSNFRLEDMRPYMPDYSAAIEYVQGVQQSPLRRAILSTVDMSYQTKIQGTPRLEFEPTGRTYQTELLNAQKTAAFNVQNLEALLGPFGKGMEKEYFEERSPRWRAWYDLSRGRLLAMLVRAYEYNWACAVMKGKGAEFVDQESNRWQFKPDEEIRLGSTTEKMAEEAKRLLNRCIKENPGTPWAVLAQRELKDPLGFEVVERYVAPPPPPPRPKATPNPKPKPKPAPKKRTEKLKMIERPEPVKLPRL